MKKAMEKRFKSKITTGMLLLLMVLSIIFATGVFAANEEAAKTATEEIGVAYRGHVQNQGNMPKPEGTMVAGPEALGTRGQSLRVEGFWIELTGDVPEGANIVYEVHVQNEGWMTPVKNGTFAGTAGESQRVESIKIRLENLPGYDVYYRGHVQNVGDVPQVDGEWAWKKNGEELGTTGSSQRLEELQVKIVKQAEVTYDKAGTYGPKTGVEVIENDVSINTPDVVLQNLHIKGNLTIGEGVGEGDVTLNNITVEGETYVRGGGKNSIHINGGDYNKITIQQTSSGQVRIVATDAAGLEVVVSEDAKGEDIILEGAFENVQIDAPDVKISTQGDTTIKDMVVGKSSTGSEITLDKDTTVNKIDLNASVDMKGEGTIEKANVNSDDVTFEQKPVEETVAPEVKVPPVVTPPTPPPSSPTGPSAEDLLVAKFNNTKSTGSMVSLLMINQHRLDLTGFDDLNYYEQLIVGECLLEKTSFTNKTAIQTAITEGIKRAKEDEQAKAYIEALFGYSPQIRTNDYNVLILTYSNSLSSTQKSLLKGVYADLVVKLDAPLTEGEAFDLIVGKTTKRITSKEMPGQEILLSKLMGYTLGNADLVENLNKSQSISVNDVSLKAEQSLTICPCTTRNGEEYFENFVQAYGMNITPFWIKSYISALSINYQNSHFLINYGGGFTATEKEQLQQYYGENIINLYRALEPGESITITVMDQNYIIDSSTIMDNETKNEIRLSKLMKVSPSLATELSGKQVISFKDVKLNKPNGINVVSVLSKKNGEVFQYLTGTGTNLYPGWLETYMETLSITSEDSKIIFNYAEIPSVEVKNNLKDYRFDVMLQLSRELDDNETLSITAFGDKKTFNKEQINGNLYHLKLSDLMGVEAGLADAKTGKEEIVFSTNGLQRNLEINVSSILVKDEEVLDINNSVWLSLFQPNFEAYANSIDLQSEDNKFIVSYAGDLTTDVKTKLAGYFADAMINISRPLKEDEEVIVHAFNNKITVTRDTFDDVWGTSIRLSDLLNLKLSDDQLAANQKGSFEITVAEDGLSEQIFVSAQAILVKGEDVEYMSKYTGMSLIPKGFKAFDESVELMSDNQNQCIVRYNNGLLEPDIGYLKGLYADPLISINRRLENGESFTISAYDKSAVITNQVLRQFVDNRIGLIELLGLSVDKAPLAANMQGDVTINITDVKLKTPTTFVISKGLLKSDGTRAYQAGEGIGIYLQPDFIEAYKNNLNITAVDNKFSVTYGKPLSTTFQACLEGYYSDEIIYLSRPLADDETVTISALKKSVTVKSSMVTENNGTQIRLSDLLGITLDEKQLAAKQTGGFDITVTDKSLKSDLAISADAILVKGDEIEYLQKWASIQLKSETFETAVAAYTKALTVYLVDNIFKVTYEGNLSEADQAGLNGFYSDAYIYLSRSLVDGEEVTVNAFGKNLPVNSSMIKETDGNRIRLSQLLGITLGNDHLAARQKGGFDITVSDKSLKSDLFITADAILVKGNEIKYLEDKTVSLQIKSQTFEEAVAAYTNAIKVNAEGQTFYVSYAGVDENVAKGLDGHYADAMVYLNRPLENGEIVTVNAFGKDYIIDASKITDIDNKIRLSTLLGIKLDEDQLAAKQLGSFNISIVPQRLNTALEVYAQAILVKADGDITELNRGATLTVTNGADQAAQLGLTGVTPTTSANADGMIIGTTKLMEYKLQTADENAYVPCTDITTMVAVPGTYMVRNAASAENLAGATAEVTISPWNATDVAVDYQGFVDAPEGGWLINRSVLETHNQDFSFDAIRVNLVNLANAPTGAKITYETYNGSDDHKDLGWTDSASDGGTAGSDNLDETKHPIEAIKLELENMTDYSVIYQVYVKNRGWQSWVRDYEMAGTEGMSLPIEAIRIRIVPVPVQ